MRLIDATELLNQQYNVVGEKWGYTVKMVVDAQDIKNAPTVDFGEQIYAIDFCAEHLCDILCSIESQLEYENRCDQEHFDDIGQVISELYKISDDIRKKCLGR